MLLLSACMRETQPPSGVDTSLFSLRPGMEWIYKVDSVSVSVLQNRVRRDSVSFFWRYEMGETLESSPPIDSLFTVFRYRSNSPEGPWQIQDVLQFGKDATRAFVVENNITFVPIVFPPNVDRTWDGHIFFDDTRFIPLGDQQMRIFNDWEYRYVEMEEQVSWNGLELEELWKISQTSTEDAISLRQAEEWYAKGVGLVFREWTFWDSQCQLCCGGDLVPCQTLTWEEKAELGFSLRMELLDIR